MAERAGFVVMKKPALGGHSARGRGLGVTGHCPAHGKARLRVAAIAAP
jgi:hypothetical protein